MNKCIFLLPLLLLIPFWCPAEKFWVDSISLNQSIPCDYSLPCKSVDDFAEKLLSGDEVIFKKGSYKPLVIANIQGNINNPIIFKSEDGEVIFEHTANAKERDLIEFRNVKNVVLSGVTFNRARRASIRVNNSIGVTINNNIINESGVWGIFTNHSNDVQILNNNISGTSRQHGIYISNSGDGVLIQGNTIERALSCGIHINGDLSQGGGKLVLGDGIISNIRITENVISNVGLKGGAAINLDGAVNVEIEKNILWNLNSAGITIFKGDGALSSYNVDVKNNLIYLNESSRWALIVNNSSGPIFFHKNIVLSESYNRGVFEISSEKIKIPLASYQNFFALTGNIASINNDFILNLDDWVELSGGSDVKSEVFSFKEFFSDSEKLYQIKAVYQLQDFYQKLKAKITP